MPKKSGDRLTLRQKKLRKVLPTSRTLTEAAIKAGYSPKNAGQSGYQALQAMRGRVPDIMDRMGLSEEVLIEKHLKRHLVAKKTVYVREGKRVRAHTHEDNGTQMRALEQSFLIHGSYAPRDPKEAATFGVKVVVLDMPRPHRTITVERDE